MARILVTGVPAYGLANPTLPLVRALVAAGHRVDYLMHASFRQAVEAAGATWVPYAEELPGPLTSPGQLLRHGRALFAELAARTRELAPASDAVVATGFQPHLVDLQRTLDRPVVFSSPVFLQNDRTMRYFAEVCTGLPRPARRVLRTPALRHVLGAVAGRAVLHHRLGDLVELLAPRSAVLNISPASRLYQPFASDFDEAPCLFTGPTPTTDVPDTSFPLERLRSHHGPVVYGSLGTVFNRWTRFFRTLVDAFGGTDTLLVLATGRPAMVDELGPVPDNVIVRPFVPQAAVLGESDVCFTHGGFGTATDAVSLGVTPILTPRGADQFFNAYRLQDLDAGRVLPSSEFTVEAVRRLALGVPTDVSLAEGTARLRASFREAPGPAGAVRAIEAALV